MHSLPGLYETDLVGDSGNTEHTNLSALTTNGLGWRWLAIPNCPQIHNQIIF